MTTMTLGVVIAYPDSEPPLTGERVFIGSQDEAHDGTLVTTYSNYKWRWRLRWNYLTAEEFAAVLARANVTTSQTMILPWDATNYTVVVKQETVAYHASPGTDNFYIEFDVEELV